MKKRWEEPRILVQKFMPNEYVAACGDSGVNYLFKCDAGDGEWGDVFLNNGTNLTEDGWMGSYFEACDTTHTAPTTDDFENGYLILNGGNDETRHWVGGLVGGHYEDYERIPVIIWRGDGDIHATKNLDMNSWTTDRS